jgi:hypothetical protein
VPIAVPDRSSFSFPLDAILKSDTSDEHREFSLTRRTRAITKAEAGLAVVGLLIAAVAGIYLFSSSSNSARSTSVEIRVEIRETDPVNQIDSFDPSNITATLGYTVTLVIHNGDDEPRQFLFNAFDINGSIGAGAAGRFTFSADRVGLFKFTSYATVILYGKVSPRLTGYLTVAQ